jgi:hypothetical protein
MKKNILSEELNRFRLLINYNTEQTLTENEYLVDNLFAQDEEPFSYDSNTTPGRLRGGSNEKKGNLNMMGEYPKGAATYAVFKNKRFFYDKPRNQTILVRSSSYATWYSDYEVKIDKGTDDTKVTPTPITKTASIDIKANVEDPFQFDKINLYEEAERSLVRFIQKLKNISQDYGPETYQNYLEFVKSKQPIYVYSYASKDGDPNEKITGRYKPCKANSKTRGEYDLCLSQKRAEYIVGRLEKELPDFVGLFKAVGKGQTTQFNGKGWPTSKDTNETKPNRRFEVLIPRYETKKTIKIPTPEPIKTDVEKQREKKLNDTMQWEPDVFYWDISKVFPDVKENVILPFRKEKNSGYMMVKISELIEFFGSMGELKKIIPDISAKKFNSVTNPEFYMDSSGVKVTTPEGVFEWKFGGKGEVRVDRSYDATAMSATEYKLVSFGARDSYILLGLFAFSFAEKP